MKLLVSEMEVWKGYVTREFYHVMTDLIGNHGWKHVEAARLWDGAGTIEGKILEACGEMPEVILFWEGYRPMASHAGDVARLRCRKCFFADDVHFRNGDEAHEKFMCYAMCDTILCCYAYNFDRFYPRLAGLKRLAWVPHSASPDFMLDYNDSPENAILLSGCLEYHYPFRSRVKRLHDRQSYPIHYHPHPGYGCDFDYDRNGSVGRGYAAKFNSYRACFTDSSRYNYVVAKYFEIPATGALLLADGAVASQLKELGLVEYTHYVPVSGDDLEAKIEHVLDERNHAELDEVRRRAQQLIRERHKTSDRARLIDEICLA
jgi:hypothetical protein